jgi:hypothetical protein
LLFKKGEIVVEIKIENAILHILDSTGELPVFSQEIIHLDDEKIYNFVLGHIEKMFVDQGVKTGKVSENSKIPYLIKKIEDNFIDGSISIAEDLYKIMKQYLDIPSGDLLIVEVKYENYEYIAILKFNYKEGYTHYVDYGHNGTLNKIVINKVMFPSELQKNMEAVVINKNDLSLRVLEKDYSIDGIKMSYFSTMFLECDLDLSIKESIKVIRNVAKEITKEYYDDDFNKVAEIKEAIYDTLDSGVIEIENVANSIFRNNPEIKREYMDRVEGAGVPMAVDLEGKKPEKKLTVHKLKMDNGISLDIPVEIYRDRDIIEFVNNPDGTISIMIKNISNMKQGI